MHFMLDLHLLMIKCHFWADIEPGWYETDEGEDEAMAGGAGAMPLLLQLLAGMHPRCRHRRRHLRTRVQPRIHCRLLIPGQAASQCKTWPRGFATGRQGLVATRLLRVHSSALRLPPPTAPGSPSTPQRQGLHMMLRHGLTTGASMTIFSDYDNR